jgi:hypothetical protein
MATLDDVLMRSANCGRKYLARFCRSAATWDCEDDWEHEEMGTGRGISLILIFSDESLTVFGLHALTW